MESDSLEICRGTGKEVPAKITQRIVYSVFPHVSSVFEVKVPGTVFPFHSEDEIVAQRNLEETWAIVGRRVISRRRDGIQELGIGAETHE